MTTLYKDIAQNGIIAPKVSKGVREMKSSSINQSNLIYQYRLETFFGWFSLIAGVLAAIVFPIVSWLEPKPFDTGTLRAFIIIPFSIWYGFRCLKKAKELKEELDYANTINTKNS